MTGPATEASVETEAEIRVYRGPRGLAELGELWRDLNDGMDEGSPIHAYEWHRSFIETQEPEPEATIFVAVFTDGTLQAILPLRPIPKRLAVFGRRGLEVPTNPHVPFTDIVVRDPVRLRALMPSVLKGLASEADVAWDYILLRRTLPDSCAARCFGDAPGINGWVGESGSFQYHPLDSYEALLKTLSRKARKNLRHAHNRAEAMGQVSYHTARTREECEGLFPEFLDVEASGWKGETGTGTAIALDPGLRRFYETLMQRFADRDRCRVSVVRHDNRPISAAFDLVMGHTQYGLKIGFDESYGQIAPGTLLHWYLLETACEESQLDTYNLISDSAWQTRWRPITGELHDIAVFRPGLAGRIASVEQRGLAQARAWRRHAIRSWFASGRGGRRLAWRPWRRA